MVLFASFTLAHAHSGGETGVSTTGCTCHNVNPSAGTTAAFDPAAPTIVAPSDVVNLFLTVSTPNGMLTDAGLNVAATGGTFTAGVNTQVSLGEITHKGPTPFAGGTVDFEFTWNAPAVAGFYTLTGAGNAVNNNGFSTGDRWNFAKDLVIEVDSGCDDLDGDGYDICLDADCDDANAAINPGAAELCDELGVDEDCDTLVNDPTAADAASWWFDGDGDGFGGGSAVISCTQPVGTIATGGDCDDTNTAFYPGAPETNCEDPSDYNCDGSTGFADADSDGFAACADCDDHSSAASPVGIEVCDGADNDCDGTNDEDAIDPASFFPDGDLDGYGVPGETVAACTAPAGYAATSDDCDDVDAGVHPGAVEVWYDGVDQTCDGNDDDQDGDTHVFGVDCNDVNASVYPGAPDAWYDGVDSDCVGDSDYDQDADGADAAPPYGPGDDCDDLDGAISPLVTDPPCDGIDLDCDPVPDTCDPTGTTDTTDTTTTTDGTTPVGPPVVSEDCGCRTGGPGGSLALLLLALVLRRRR